MAPSRPMWMMASRAEPGTLNRPCFFSQLSSGRHFDESPLHDLAVFVVIGDGNLRHHVVHRAGVDVLAAVIAETSISWTLRPSMAKPCSARQPRPGSVFVKVT